MFSASEKKEERQSLHALGEMKEEGVEKLIEHKLPSHSKVNDRLTDSDIIIIIILSVVTDKRTPGGVFSSNR